jgi:hypothetical protein
MRFTIFPDRWASVAELRDEPYPTVCAMFADPPTYPAKSLCQWIKFGVFDGSRSPKGSLRTNRALVCVSALEGDFDRGDVSIDEAANMARAAGLRAILYTSASHRPATPRWRVVAPLAREHPRSERRELMERLNGVFGGVLSRESFTDSQAYYWGRVAGAEYRCILT